MVPIKIQCACGQKYAFDVEPVNGRMPQPVACPACGADGTAMANQIIAHSASALARNVVAAASKPSRSKTPLMLAAVVPVFFLAGGVGYFMVRHSSPGSNSLPPAQAAVDVREASQKLPGDGSAQKIANGSEDAEFAMELASTGAAVSNKIDPRYFSWYKPMPITLSKERPQSFKALPADLKAPSYGMIKLGPTKTEFGVIIDEPESDSPRLFVDANANGNFTDDPPVRWEGTNFARESIDPKTHKKVKNEFKQHHGSALLQVRYGAEKHPLGIQMYSIQTGAKAPFLGYYRDYARVGRIKFGDREHKVVLDDEFTRGNYIPGAGDNEKVTACIDLNDDGKFSLNFEGYHVGEPFNIRGTSYKLTVLDEAGSRVKLSRSETDVPERKDYACCLMGK